MSTTEDGETVSKRSAASVRAELTRAHREYERGLAMGRDEEMSAEAEAGAELEAEWQHAIWRLAEDYREVHKEQ